MDMFVLKRKKSDKKKVSLQEYAAIINILYNNELKNAHQKIL